MISLTLPIHPVAWGRVKRGRYGQAYVPPKTARYERDVARLLRSAWKGPALEGALKVSLTFFLAKPKRCKRAHPAVRPDLDNFSKGVLDAGNGILWADDGQIVECVAAKAYGEPPRVEMVVERLG